MVCKACYYADQILTDYQLWLLAIQLKIVVLFLLFTWNFKSLVKAFLFSEINMIL